jgi:hypothetical protein
LCKFFIGSCGADAFAKDTKGLTPKDHVAKNISVMKAKQEEIVELFTELEQLIGSSSSNAKINYVININICDESRKHNMRQESKS